MGEWLVGIVGIISLGLLLEILIPDGQTSKYVRGAFSLLVIFVVISPIPNFFDSEKNFDFDSVSYDIDLDYVDGVSIKYTSSLEEDMEMILEEQGIKSTVEIVAKDGSVRDIDFVAVKISLSGIDENGKNTFISRTAETVSNYLGISRDQVQVGVEYGSD